MILLLRLCYRIVIEFLMLWKFIILRDGTKRKEEKSKNRLRILLKGDSLILFKEAMQ